MTAEFTGQIFEVPVGQGGLVGTRNQALIQPDQLIVARNLSYEGAVLRKEGGASKYNSSVISGAPVVLGGWDWWPTTALQRMIVALSDGTIKKDSGAGTFPTTLASGLTITGTIPVFVEAGKEAAAGNRKLFIFTGSNQVRVLSGDGATATAIATPPADWAASFPTFGVSHIGKLWGGGNSNDPHRLYYSTSTNHEDFTGAGSGSLSIFAGEGERIVGALSFKSLIVVWKFPLGIYLVNTSDPSVANWTVSKLTGGTGGVSPLGAVAIDNDVVFLDAASNFQVLSSVNEFGDMQSNNISRVTNVYSFVQDNFNLGQLGRTRGVYYAAKREVHFAMTGLGSSINNVRFVLDLNQPNRFRFRYSDRDVCESIWLRKDSNTIQRLFVGDDTGFVWNLDTVNKDKDGVGYTGAFQTPYMDFSWVDPKLGTVRKIGQYLECLVAPTGNWNLSVDVLWDGNLVQNITFNMGISGAAIGSFTLGTDRLAGDQILNRKRRLVGSGRRLSLSGSNQGAGQDFALARFFLHCLIGDERLGRDAT
jgi:hypothetical protein